MTTGVREGHDDSQRNAAVAAGSRVAVGNKSQIPADGLIEVVRTTVERGACTCPDGMSNGTSTQGCSSLASAHSDMETDSGAPSIEQSSGTAFLRLARSFERHMPVVAETQNQPACPRRSAGEQHHQRQRRAKQGTPAILPTDRCHHEADCTDYPLPCLPSRWNSTAHPAIPRARRPRATWHGPATRRDQSSQWELV